MKFFAVATALMLVLATTVAGKAVHPAKTKSPKSCTTLSECPCTPEQTKFCGNEAVNPKCLKGHIFECDKTKGKACDLGISDSCVSK